MIKNAVIPVAGHGTRLLPATKSQPKEMLPVGKKPIVQYVVEELARSGCKQILFVTGRGKDSIENHFDHNPELVSSLRQAAKDDLLEQLEFENIDIHYLYTRQSVQKEQLKLLEQHLGVKHCPEGVLRVLDLRQHIKPISISMSAVLQPYLWTT